MADDAANQSRPRGTDDKVRRLTLVLGPMLWAFGVLLSLLAGVGCDQAVLKATAYALSGLIGWAVYLLLRKRSAWSWGELFYAWIGAAMINVSLLGPTRTPWPFSAMLAHGVIVLTIFMVLAALVVRWIKGRQRFAV